MVWKFSFASFEFIRNKYYFCKMIFYLSNTGNSLWAAETVAKETDDKIVSILEALRNDYTFSLSKNERIGFVFPVHGWRPPQLMRRFIQKLVIDNSAEH